MNEDNVNKIFEIANEKVFNGHCLILLITRH